MSLKREDVETALKAFNIECYSHQRNCPTPQDCLCASSPENELGKLVTVLCSLPCNHPKPSREELETILDNFYLPFHNTLSGKEVCLDKIMSLFTGKKRKVWCSHTRQDESGNWLVYVENTQLASSWSWNLPDHYMKFCPICGTPRPKDE